jgi:hypothetical protein
MKINMSQFLDKEKEIAHKDIVAVVSEAGWVESKKWKKEDGITPVSEFRVDIKLKNGDIRNTTLNWSNVKLLVEAWGDETKSWLNKELRAWKTKSEKAKSGFTYIYVPTNWERNDMGEWITNGTAKDPENQDTVQVEDEVINPKDIPF